MGQLSSSPTSRANVSSFLVPSSASCLTILSPTPSSSYVSRSSFCRVALMPPFVAGDFSYLLNSLSDGALALMCPNLLFFAPLPLRDKARHKRWMSALAPRLQASLMSSNSKDTRSAISRRLCLFSTFPSCQILKLAADQVPSKTRPPASHCAPAVIRSLRLCAKISLRSSEAAFVTSHYVRLSLEKCRSATDCSVVIQVVSCSFLRVLFDVSFLSMQRLLQILQKLHSAFRRLQCGRQLVKNSTQFFLSFLLKTAGSRQSRKYQVEKTDRCEDMWILTPAGCFHPAGATNMTFIVEGANTVSSWSCAHQAT